MKSRDLRLLPLLGLAALWLAAGCSENSNPAAPHDSVTQTDADDVAQQVGASLAADNGGTMAAMAACGEVGTSAKTAPGDEVTFDLGGITYTLTRTFYNAQDEAQLAYDPVTSVRVVTTARAAGAIETPRYQATLGHASRLDVVGIAAWQDTLRFNGSANDTLMSSFTSLDSTRTRHFYCESGGDLDDVVYAKPIAAGQWPLRGTATYAILADRLRDNERAHVEAHFAASVLVRFNGTRDVVIEVNHTWSYQLDLKTGVVIRLPA